MLFSLMGDFALCSVCYLAWGLRFCTINYGQNNAFPLINARLKWLLIFGVAHSVFIFSGDILINYALAGFLVYKELGNHQAIILKKAKTYFAIGFVVLILFSLIPSEPIYRGSEEYLAILAEWQAGYGNQLIQQIIFTVIMLVFSLVCFVWVTAGIVLFGVYLYRLDFFTNGLLQFQLTSLVVVTLVISTADAIIRVNWPALAELNMALATLSALFCALLYIHIIIKLAKKVSVLKALFAPVGRMAFSLYLLQSIVFAIFFRYSNIDFVNEATRIDYLYLCILFSLVQLALAGIYLKLFSVGPVEWLWRKAYNKSLQSVIK